MPPAVEALAVLQGLAVLLAILLSLQFYGRLLLRLLWQEGAADAGLCTAAGIAAVCVAAGGLEASCGASRTLLIGVIAAGFILQLARMASRGLSLPADTAVLLASPIFIIFAVLFALLLIDLTIWNYPFIDDRLGYLVFPRRILLQGCIGRDPFQFRRVEVGLGGGGAYVTALFQSMLSASQTRLADPGLGGACLMLLVDGHAKRLGLSPARRGLALLAGLVVVVFSPIINNTPETLGKAELFALLRVAAARSGSGPSWRRGTLLALFFCCLALLKTSYVPPACAVLIALYGVLLIQRRSAMLVAEAGLAASCAVVLLLPWMLVTHAIAGTLWYPLLGTGTLGHSETAGFATLPHFIRDGGRLAAIMMPACLAAWLGARRGLFGAAAPVMLAIPAVMLLVVLVAQLKFTVFGYRYGEMGAAALLLFYLPFTLLPGMLTGWWRPMQGALAGLVLLILVTNNTLGYRWFDDGRLAQVLLGQPRAAAPDGLIPPGTPGFQRAILPGSKLLVLVTWPSLIDFHRNDVSVMDWPGMIGPPGMPSLEDGAGWLRFLLRNRFDYVAYSYGDEAGYTDRQLATDIARLRFSQYQVDLLEHFGNAKRLFLAMKACAVPHYDDGVIAVIDLRAIAPDCLGPAPLPNAAGR